MFLYINFFVHFFLRTLLGGTVSLWDPLKSLKPLSGFIQNNGWITDISWNTSNYNILATSSDNNAGMYRSIYIVYIYVYRRILMYGYRNEDRQHI